MTDSDAVLAAARARADALAAGDEGVLRRLLHPDFVWTSHRGEVFDRAAYLRSNVGGRNEWHGQELHDTEVRVVGDTAVLTGVVVDTVAVDGAGAQEFRMPMTQTWVRTARGWRCLAGHAGPRLAG